MNRVEKTVRDARALLAKGWIRGGFSRFKDGGMCYCALGALNMASGKRPSQTFGLSSSVGDAGAVLFQEELESYGRRNLASFNDDQTSVEPVLALFDRVIEMAAALGL